MNKRLSLAVLIGLGLVAIVSLTWLTERSSDAAPGPASGPQQAPDLERPVSGVDEPAAEPGATETAARTEVADDPVGPGPAPEPPARAGMQWLEGRVVHPEGTPIDERLRVLAVDRPRKLRQLVGSPSLVDMAWDPELQRTRALVASAEVEPGGRFHIELPLEARSAHLALTGRYLFSMATTEVALPAEPGPVLTGELGAWITGRLLPPPDPGPLESDFEWIRVELGPDVSSGFDTTRIDALGVTRGVEASADGSFEFRGIPGAGAYGISVEHRHLAALLRLGLDPAPGEHLQLELPMVRGATLRGRVVDDRGTPISNARVEARHRGVLGSRIGALREAGTDEQGAFELPHVAIGKIDVVAQRKGLREGTLALENELRDGMTLEGLELVLATGARIEGRVLFPDGAPAPAVEVLAGPDLKQLGGMDALKLTRAREGRTTTETSGRFEITGLAPGTFDVTAYVTVEQGEHAGAWRATERGLTPGGEAVELRLEPLAGVRGRVVDVAGEPIPEFDLRATLQGSGGMLGIGAERRRGSFQEAEDGRFSMQGFAPGTWDLVVSADGYATSEVLELALPLAPDTPEPLFVLAAGSAASGLVFDTLGAPVAGARVFLDLDLASRMQAEQGEGVPETFSDAGGRFRLEGLDPGNVSLVASLEGFAPSEAVPCELLSGLETEQLVLRLRTGGSLTGIVYDELGEPLVGAMVIAQHTPTFSSQHMLTSDSGGEFRIEHLEPGTWQVVATSNFISGEASLADDDADMGQLLGSMKMAAVEIVDGQETHVELGAPPADPVLVHGRVTHSGEPVAGAVVTLMTEGAEGLSAMSGLKMKVTDGTGAFEVRLDAPGAYLLTVQTGISTGAQNRVEYVERIPEGVEEHELEVELPVGRISGRVLGPRGAALAGCRVTLVIEGGVAFGSIMGGNYVETTTDAQGRYDAGFLRSGTYTVAAGGLPLGLLGAGGGEGEGGRAIKSGVTLSEGQWLDDLDFHLDRPGTLSGVVLDPSGQPVGGASVFVRDADGRLLERFSMLTTDAGGRFSYPGVAPGRYTFVARKADRVSRESSPVSVSAGETAEAQVTLLQGTVLRIAVVDRTGAEVRARISVTDRQGREHAGMLSLSDMLEGGSQPYSSEEQLVGPLADDTYTVTAIHDDGRPGRRQVQLKGQGQRKTTIRLK